MAKLVVGENDLETWCKANKRDDLLDEWDYEKNRELVNGFGVDISKPCFIMPNSNVKVWWKCSYGHRFESTVGNRVVSNRGCPFCAGSKLLKGYNDFETWCNKNDRTDLLDEWNYEKNDGIKPCDIIQGGAGKKYWWKGPCGHEWDAVISSRTSVRQGKSKLIKTAGCPYCSNPPKRILVGFNDFETWCKNNNREDLIFEWNSEKNIELPTEVTFSKRSVSVITLEYHMKWHVIYEAVCNRRTFSSNSKSEEKTFVDAPL